MAVIHLVLNDCFLGLQSAYIYILYSKIHRVVYIGETNDANGIIGRLNAHVSINGTFRTRLMEKRGISLDEVRDLAMFAYRLPSEPEFVSIEKAYRRGVEYLVQFRFREICGELNPYLYVVSNVNYSEPASQVTIEQIARNIVDEFKSIYA